MKTHFVESVSDIGISKNIFCEAVGNPLPDFKWFLDTVEVKNSSHIIIKNEIDNNGSIKSNLLLINTRKEHGGLYTCEATNRVGKSRYAARVNIHGM